MKEVFTDDGGGIISPESEIDDRFLDCLDAEFENWKRHVHSLIEIKTETLKPLLEATYLRSLKRFIISENIDSFIPDVEKVMESIGSLLYDFGSTMPWAWQETWV